jgi:hypothetical protein
MADPMLLKALLGVGAIAASVGVLAYAKGAFKATKGAVEDPPGASVFIGSETDARKACNSLADAGISAWLVRKGDDHLEVQVDAEQAEQVPQLLMVQAEMSHRAELEQGEGQTQPEQQTHAG